MPVFRLKVVSIPVSDQDRAKSFYVDKLGFEVRSDNPMGEGQRWVEVAPPGSFTSFTLVTWFPSLPAGSLQGMVLETEDVRARYAELKGRGVPFGQEIEEAFWGTLTTFSDPDGNGWVLAQSRGQ